MRGLILSMAAASLFVDTRPDAEYELRNTELPKKEPKPQPRRTAASLRAADVIVRKPGTFKQKARAEAKRLRARKLRRR